MADTAVSQRLRPVAPPGVREQPWEPNRRDTSGARTRLSPLRPALRASLRGDSRGNLHRKDDAQPVGWLHAHSVATTR
jgi:hypothetical protein